MRPSVTTAVVILLTYLPAFAGEPAQPNTLTPKEIADGWILLFDGETTFGMTTSGDVEVTKGQLVLGGDKKAASVISNTAWLDYDLSIEFLRDGAGTFHPGWKARARERFHSWKVFAGWCKLDLRVRGSEEREEAEWKFLPLGSGGHSFKSRPVNPMPWGPSQPSLSIDPDGTIALHQVRLRPVNTRTLFNGQDLTGWKVFPGKKSSFTVENGAIVCKNGPGDLQTVGKYGDFVLQFECKVNGKRLNSGIFFRCKANEYQNGYEAQIHNNFTADPPKSYTVDDYDPKTHKLLGQHKVQSAATDYGTGAIYRRVPARKAAARDGEWFTMTIVAQGNHLATWVNGIQQTDWYDNRPKSDNPRTGCRLEPGHISIQGHDPTTNLSFRNIRIAELPSAK